MAEKGFEKPSSQIFLSFFLKMQSFLRVELDKNRKITVFDSSYHCKIVFESFKGQIGSETKTGVSVTYEDMGGRSINLGPVKSIYGIVGLLRVENGNAMAIIIIIIMIEMNL